MKGVDQVEFYDGKHRIAVVDSSMVPPVESLISIRKETWRVTRITYALDHADEWAETSMRACVDVVAHKPR